MRWRTFLCQRFVVEDWLVHRFFQRSLSSLGGHDKSIVDRATTAYNELRPCTVVMDYARAERKARHTPP